MATSMELAARLATVVATQQELLSVVNDPVKVMQLVVKKAPEATSGSGAIIEMVEGNELMFGAASGAASSQIGLRLALKDSLSGVAIKERRSIRCDNVETDPRVNGAAARSMGIRSMIVAPLIEGDTAIGALLTFSSQANAFDDLDAYTLELLAGMTSVALMQAHLFRARKASEERYRQLFERNVAGVFRTTIDGRFLDCNDALATYLGYTSREELLSRETWDVYHDRADRQAFLDNLKRDGALTNLRLHLKKKDGSSVTALVNASFVPWEGGETHLLGTLVTEE